jgi:hypothetical protein
MMAEESEEVAAMSPNTSGETAVEESESDGSASEYRPPCDDVDEESMDPFASSGEDDDDEGGSHSEDEEEYAEEETLSIGEVTGANAMLTDMPDENNTALAKRRAIQSVMQDRGFSAVERNRKIQDIMAGRVELQTVASDEVAAESSNAGKAAAAEESESDGSESEDSRSMSDDEEESMDSAAASEDERNLTGGEAMLRDMPDEDETTLAKRKAVQSVMQDRSLSVLERNKTIQDIMSGRVELPRVVAVEEPANTASRRRSRETKKSAESSESKGYSRGKRRNGIDRDDSRKGVYSSNINDANEAETSRVDVGAGAIAARVAPDGSLSASASRRAKRDSIEGDLPGVRERTNAVRGIAMGEARPLPPRPPPMVSKSESKNENHQPNKTAAPLNARLPSNDGGLRTAIADQWKQRMITVHPRSHDDLLDILLAHQYRLSLKTPPRQSFFRVVALVFFSRMVDGVVQSERYHVVGTNDEPHSVGGSICAERAALMQLRFIPDLKEITKIVIVTDEVDAISPGMLCREFMASHNCIPWEVPIVLGRSVCRKCGLTVGGKVCSDVDGCFDTTKNNTLCDANAELFSMCSEGHKENKHKDYSTPHDFLGVRTTLRDLFPYPSLYARMTANEAVKFGEDFIEKKVVSNPLSKKKANTSIRAHLASTRSYDDGETLGSHRQDRFDLAMLTGILEEEEMGRIDGGSSNGATSRHSNRGSINSATLMQRNGTNQDTKSSMSNSLRTTIALIRTVAEDCHTFDGSSEKPVAALHHLTARTIRIPDRLKPSQRREKLMRLATEVTALESHVRHVHPVCYGAAVLFSDGTVAFASQKVALEYGCTLDAVGQLANAIDRKAIYIEDEEPCRPIMLVQCDQFGIAHAPFAQGRAFLAERGYGDCKILLHQLKKRRNRERSGDEDRGVGENLNAENRGDCDKDLRLLEVDANDLAPSPPDMFGHLITKNHSQGGIQIKF